MSPAITTVGIKATILTDVVVSDVAAGTSLGSVDSRLVSAISTETAITSDLELLEWDLSTWTVADNVAGELQRASADDDPALYTCNFPMVTGFSRIRNNAGASVWIQVWHWRLV